MNVPVIIYNVAKIMAIISLVVEILSAVVAVAGIGLDTNDSELTAIDGLFSSGIRIRNSALCFLILLFFIANKQMKVKGLSALASISSVCGLYAKGSIVVMAIGILASILSSVLSDRSQIAKNLGGKIWTSGISSTIIGFVIAYFFYIP